MVFPSHSKKAEGTKIVVRETAICLIFGAEGVGIPFTGSRRVDLACRTDSPAFPTAIMAISRGGPTKVIPPSVYSFPGLAWGLSPQFKRRCTSRKRNVDTLNLVLGACDLPCASASARFVRDTQPDHGRHNSGIVRVRARRPWRATSAAIAAGGWWERCMALSGCLFRG